MSRRTGHCLSQVPAASGFSGRWTECPQRNCTCGRDGGSSDAGWVASGTPVPRDSRAHSARRHDCELESCSCTAPRSTPGGLPTSCQHSDPPSVALATAGLHSISRITGVASLGSRWKRPGKLRGAGLLIRRSWVRNPPGPLSERRVFLDNRNPGLRPSTLTDCISSTTMQTLSCRTLGEAACLATVASDMS